MVTRADFDGVVCGALVTLMEDAVDSFLFVEPKFMQDGAVEIHAGDIIANLPYHPNCTLWFDHHITNAPNWERHLGVSSREGRVPSAQPETRNLKPKTPTIVPGKGGFRIAPSAARVVYEYYTSVPSSEFRVPGSLPQHPTPDTRHPTPSILNSERMKFLLDETDKIDAALLTREDVLNPQGYVLISMTIDGKRPEDEPYWMKLIEFLRDAPLEQTLADPEIATRCRQILDDQEKLKKILLTRTAVRDNVIVTDLRGVKDLPDGNRFLLYTLFPESNISLKIGDDAQRANTTAISVGYNIFNTTSKVNVGALMEKHGGGGHHVVGSCRVAKREAEKHIRDIFEAIKE